MKMKKILTLIAIIMISVFVITAGYLWFTGDFETLNSFTRRFSVQEIQYKPQIRIAEEDVQKARELFEKNNLDYSNVDFFEVFDSLQTVFVKGYQSYDGIYDMGELHIQFDRATDNLVEKRLSNKLMGKPNIDLVPSVSVEQAFKTFVKEIRKEGNTRTYMFKAYLMIDDQSGDYLAARKDALIWVFKPVSGEYPHGGVDAHTGKSVFFVNNGYPCGILPC